MQGLLWILHSLLVESEMLLCVIDEVEIVRHLLPDDEQTGS